MENTIPTPLDASIAPQADNAPPMATEIAPPTSVLNGHTPPIGDEYGDGAPPADLNASIEGKGDGKGSWTPGFRAQTAPERALKWDRYFTQPGQDAFDTIDWEMRSAGITGEDGKSVFEQTGCEIPKPWSQLATNVVVSKYFRGPINSPQRESSVKQVIGRVADTIGLWGAQGGYFASDEDTASFREELAYLLVHQYGAFNSPVWFNLGVKDARQQCSACQPYDALVSTPAGLIPIGELVERDAVGQQVFTAEGVARILATKHNGRKEVLRLHLKSGYTLDVTADHLVWKARSDEGGKWVEAGTLKADDMLAWHRTAIVDKSQELTNEVAEAALAGWLQSDGFVGRYTSGTNKSLTIEAMTVNAAEEKWVRAALDAVFPDAHSHTRGVVTQDEDLNCQRIRIYGDFMEPFIQKWGLMTRGNAMTVPPMLYTAPLPVVVAYLRSLFQAEGYVSVRDNARIAFDMVSEGIVRGVQSLLGRLGIYARVRFKADTRDDRQGCWCLSINPRGDRELFAHEIGFIAPEKQDKVTASLKLDGHEVTARKAMQIERIEVRGETDVYDIQTTSGEYLSNGIRVHNCFINDVYDDMESIMELAATEARLFKGGSGAGANLWRIRSSKEHLRGGGIASGPISFMRGWDAFAGAVKCLTPDAQVYTDQGLRTVGELIDPSLEPGFHADDSVVLATKDGPTRISQVYVSPKSPTREMELAHTGLRLRGTHQHPVLTLTPQFELEWKALSQIGVGDRVAVARGQEMWPEMAPTFDFAPQTTWAKLDLTYPARMTPELARLLGYMTSEGCMDAERFRFCNADKDVFADFLRCVEAVFGHDGSGNVSERTNEKTGVTTQMFEACWTNAVRFLQVAGLGFEKSGEKRVPRSILSSPRELVVEFLRAYFEGDGHVSTYVYASSASRLLLGDVQLLLLNMGMLPLLRRHPVNGKDYWNLVLRGEAAFRFVREVGFISARKQAASDVAGDKNTNIDTLPFLVDVLRQYTEKNGYFHCSDGQTRELGFGFFNRKAGSAISYNRLRNTPALLDQLEQVNPQLAQTLEWLMEREFFWDTVKSVEAATPAVTYDFTVPQTHSFVANGIVNHNSGGTTRRAAKMVILNADHPDIGEFITCKADEEKKAWALIEAGYNGGFNVPGGAYDSVAFQNANHSVRVTDEFMQAAENDGKWNLRAVTTGKTTDTVSARQMLKDIAQTTWICGDPGMQFDTIINDWHTCANSDRIYASNPCCVTGDTLVGVADGRSAVAIQDLVGTEVPVYAHDHATGRTTVSRMWNIEVKRRDVPVYRITLDDGSSFRATDDHLIMLRDGSYRMVKDLKTDDSLMPFHSKNQQVWDGSHWSNAPQPGDAVVSHEVLSAPVERCCPVCRDNFYTNTPTSLFCSKSCRTSPMGREMSGQATRALNSLWNDEPNSTDALRAARLLLDQNIEPAFGAWGEQRQIAAELGATRVPTAAQLPNLFDSETAFRESAILWNHKVVAVEFCGTEDVYDGTVDTHHNFAILTSADQSCETSQQNFSGIFIHNSEFMFLDSTACNLASLNLLKFYDMETGDFDAAAYAQACETFLTAQEIIVSFASYPTRKIGEMSEQYRPLGLGYANLGALLMAKGLAYDSDEGRALAGALTAIMTGAGYRKSAQIARNTGPFEGYAANKEPMLRVIAKHRDAVNSIDASLVAQNVMDEARRVWDDAYMTGQKYGYRNSQATVLAPTGCLVAGSLVSTDKGLVRLERLGNPDGAQWQNADFRVYTDGGAQNATKFFINGMEETRVITTQAGYAIQGTGKHRVKVVNARTGVWEWKHFRDLEAGDLLPLAMNTIIGEAQSVKLPPLGQLHWNGEWNTHVPAQMTADLAELVGYFMGDGSLHAKGLRFCVAQGDDDVVARLSALGRELFGLEAHLTQQKGYVEVMLSSVSLAHWWDAAGFAKALPNSEHRGKGYVPRVPDAVLHSNDAHVYGAFLRGLFEADGTNTLGVPSVSTAHKTFADEIRSLSLALGFPTSSKVDTSQWGNSDLHVQRLRNGSYNPQWLSKIGFMGARKTAGIIELKGEMSGKGDRVFLPRAVWDELVPCGHPLRNAMVVALGRHGGVARGLAAQIYAQTGDERVAHVLNYFFNEVQSNEDGGEQMTYDLSVPGNVTYVANGFVSHNTISFMMDCDTTGVEPDIALVKYKKLVGGGLLKIVNQTVPAALRNLGYDESEIKTIVDYIDKNDTIEGAPGLQDKDLPVFDCAFKAMNGTRSIHHMGHIKMMAATQPFISGAISKTVNMPQDCTADEIYDAYLQSWKMGVKAVAIYRDGSKRTQPLSTASDAQKAEKADKDSAIEKKEGEIRRAARRKLPDERNSITHKFSIAGQEGYFMVGLYEDNSPGEIFIKMSKEGSTISGLMDSFAVAVSMCLQYGVPLRVLVNKFSHTRFEPSGYTTNRDIPIAKSLMDYIFRWFDLKFQPNGDNGYAGKTASGTAPAALPEASLFAPESSASSNGIGDGGNHGNVGNAQREVSQMQQDAPPCPDCGALTVRSGACYKCNECGATTGCG